MDPEERHARHYIPNEQPMRWGDWLVLDHRLVWLVLLVVAAFVGLVITAPLIGGVLAATLSVSLVFIVMATLNPASQEPHRAPMAVLYRWLKLHLMIRRGHLLCKPTIVEEGQDVGS